MRKNKRGSHGFTMIELIVGVLILAVITGPLLHSFVTSAHVSLESRKMRNATLTAQNLVEQVKANGIPALISEAGKDPKYAFYRKEDGAYVKLDTDELADITDEESVYHLGIDDVNYGADTYNAMVTLTAEAEEYQDPNSNKVAVYMPMDAVFTQPSSTEENPDIVAAGAIANDAQLASMTGDESGVGVFYTSLDFIQRLTRTITINVTDTALSEGGGYVTANVTMHYSAVSPFDGVTYTYDIEESEFFKDYYSASQTAADVLKAMYFFYYPDYYKDIIYLNNLNGIKFTFFLIEQELTDNDYGYGSGSTKHTAISAKEATYNSKVSFRVSEPFVAIEDTTILVTVLTNIPEDITDRQTLIGDFYYDVYKDMHFTTRLIADSILVATEPQNRIYQINVELFTPDKEFADGTGVVTFKASLRQ